MEDAESTVGKTTAHHPPQRLINHRKLVATIFPPTEVGGDDRDEMLHCAASQGMLSFVLALLRAAADERSACDLPDRFGRTALHWAAEQGRRNVVHALLRAGARVDSQSQRKVTPIMLAALKGHVEVVRLLVHYYRDGKPKCGPLSRHRRGIGHSRCTALHCAAAGGHVRVVELLLGAGFDREQRSPAGLTPAEVSARKSHPTSVDVTRLLLPTSDMGGKLVHDRVCRLPEDVVTVSGLAKGGAFLDWQDRIGTTPLYRAVYFGHDTISRTLLKAGADPNLSDKNGTGPLHVAAYAGCGQMVADLLEAGADTELVSDFPLSPLHTAVVKNKVNVVSILVKAGAFMERRDATLGQTSLSWACRGCLAPIVRVLVEAGADVESRSPTGLTPLQWACRFIDAGSVEALLNAGADPGAVDLAAAIDAAENSSSGRGMSVSRPAAIDVIGLGYPPDPMEESTGPFTGGSVTLEDRRLDLASVQRIKLALKGAKKEFSWGRRGWLVILANRCFAMKLSGVRDMRQELCRDGCARLLRSALKPRCVYTSAEHLPCAFQNGVANDLVTAISKGDCDDGCNSPYLQEDWSSGQDDVGKRLRSVDSVSMVARVTSRHQNYTQGDIGGEANAASRLSELIAALLGLAAVEVAVFQRVVTFI